MRPTIYKVAGLLATSILAACGGSSPGSHQANAGSPNSGSPNGTGNTSSDIRPAPKSKFAMANGCYALKSDSANTFALLANDHLSFSALDSASAEPLMMRPATLGKYLLYTTNRRFASEDTNGVAISASPSDRSIWNIEYDQDSDTFELENYETGNYLAVSEAGDIIQNETSTGNNTAFQFIPIAGNLCTEYPEMPVGVRGTAFKGNGVDKPIIGFADSHGHVTTAHETSLFDTNKGPAFGGTLYGQLVHKFGVTHALHDCAENHGDGGSEDFAQTVAAAEPGRTHDTQGWPTFIDWPANDSFSHASTYYRFIERSWMAGQRVLVNQTSNYNPLCELATVARRQPQINCNDMYITRNQIAYTYELQDYVDAQWGGPGKGWFRVVKTPGEAREVINDGKLAVILGTEIGQLFDCTLSYDALGNRVSGCTTEDIDEQMDELWDLGVRHIMPYHDSDTSLGGTGIIGRVADVLNVVNFYDTGRFYETVPCREYNEDIGDEPGGAFSTSVPGGSDDPVIGELLNLTGGTGLVPVYPEGRRCNAFTLSDLGKYTIRRLMTKGFVVDIDHASWHGKDEMLDLADEFDPPYPWTSTHDMRLSDNQAARIYANGGMMTHYKLDAAHWIGRLEATKRFRELAGPKAKAYPLALGLGVDPNGFAGHTGPRANPKAPVIYPIELFRGEGWPAAFANFDPVYLDLLTIPESGKFWHIDEVGQAHYGMLADFVEELRIEGGEEALSALFNSAEEYIRIWENVDSRR